MALPDFTMRQLLEAGVHFGHQTHRWNPKMDEYIFGARNNVHILDLAQTVPLLHQALKAVSDTVAKGGRLLMVGTKRQAQEAVAQSATDCAQYYVNARWLGGMLTNWKTISNSIKRLNQLEEMLGGEALPHRVALGVEAVEIAGLLAIAGDIDDAPVARRGRGDGEMLTAQPVRGGAIGRQREIVAPHRPAETRRQHDRPGGAARLWHEFGGADAVGQHQQRGEVMPFAVAPAGIEDRPGDGGGRGAGGTVASHRAAGLGRRGQRLGISGNA